MKKLAKRILGITLIGLISPAFAGWSYPTAKADRVIVRDNGDISISLDSTITNAPASCNNVDQIVITPPNNAMGARFLAVANAALLSGKTLLITIDDTNCNATYPNKPYVLRLGIER